MLGYFEKRAVVQWTLPSENRPGRSVLDGVLPLEAQVEMQERASAARTYREGIRGRNGVKLDPVLRAHLGLERFGE